LQGAPHAPVGCAVRTRKDCRNPGAHGAPFYEVAIVNPCFQSFFGYYLSVISSNFPQLKNPLPGSLVTVGLERPSTTFYPCRVAPVTRNCIRFTLP
jgi:hypothetical protein